MMWYSQTGQDAWVVDTLGDRAGYFVDVGAYDGIQTSNTYALELAGWHGVCIEASPAVAAACASNRRCRTVHAAATNRTGTVRFAGDRIVASRGVPVPADTLTAILDRVGAPEQIDYMSLDIEGGEFDALSAFDFDRYRVLLMTVEHNLYCEGPGPKQALYELLTEVGFDRVREDVLCLSEIPMYHGVPYEDWYCSAEFLAGRR